MPTLSNIIETIKSFISGDIPNSVDELVSIPIDWIIENYTKMFDWLIWALKKVLPFFESAGQSIFELFTVENASDIVSLSYVFMGIAGCLLLVKLIFWFLG